MTDDERWQETVIAGKLFAVLTEPTTALPHLSEVEAVSIGKPTGTIRLHMKDGRKFEVTVRLLK